MPNEPNRLVRLLTLAATSVAGGIAAMAAAAALTLILSLALCLGYHPEAAMGAEWAAPVAGLIWAGALVRKAGRGASVGAGLVVGITWMGSWLWLMGRFEPELWLAEAAPAVTWRHIAAWLAAPALSTTGGMLAAALQRHGKVGKAALHIAAPVMVLAAAIVNGFLLEAPGTHKLGDGVTMEVQGPDSEGTTTRLFTFDFAEDPRLRMGIYDRDSDDSRPYDDSNSSYFGTPGLTVFDKRGPGALMVVNAGFFTWTRDGRRIASHIAPVVKQGQAHYNVHSGYYPWTFGWKVNRGVPEFILLHEATFEELEHRYDYALGLVRPLIVDGQAIEMKPGPGVTRLRCSRTSLGWTPGTGKLQLLVVRDPDGERASIEKWKAKTRQVGGWDQVELQRFWLRQGVRNAVVLDGGDSTQLVYKGNRGRGYVASGRLSRTLGYLRDRPLRIWLPILPVRHSDAGILNYIYVERAQPSNAQSASSNT